MQNNDLRELIIEKASELTARYGFRKTSLNDIAEACGKRKSTLYHYFSGKEEIIEAVINSHINRFETQIIKAVNSVNNADEKLIIYCKTRIKLVSEVAAGFSTFSSDYMDEHSYIEKMRHRYDIDEMRMIKSILLLGIEQGIFRNLEDPDEVAEAIVVAMKGFEYKWAMDADKNRLMKKVEKMIDILFIGIKK